MTNNECIEIHLDAETKQLAERTAATLGYTTLTEFFIYFIQKSRTTSFTRTLSYSVKSCSVRAICLSI